MPTRSEQRRINIQRGRPMNEGLADCENYSAPKEEAKENKDDDIWIWTSKRNRKRT